MTEESETREADCLHLHIMKCSCSCGNKWEHSNLWLASRSAGYLGGTPDAMQSIKLPCLSMEETLRNYEHCFRCVPLSLGKNWVSPIKLILTKPGRAAPPATNGATLEELLS